MANLDENKQSESVDAPTAKPRRLMRVMPFVQVEPETNEEIASDPEPGEPGEIPPLGFTRSEWFAVPRRLRDEALARASMFTFQGTHPDEALSRAIHDILEDEFSAESPFEWQVVHAILETVDGAKRSGLDRRPSEEAVSLAMKVESLAQAEILERGAAAGAADYFAAFGAKPAACQAAVAACLARIRTLKAELKRNVPPPEISSPTMKSRPSGSIG